MDPTKRIPRAIKSIAHTSFVKPIEGRLRWRDWIMFGY
jgi:hypothetical protein